MDLEGFPDLAYGFQWKLRVQVLLVVVIVLFLAQLESFWFKFQKNPAREISKLTVIARND